MNPVAAMTGRPARTYTVSNEHVFQQQHIPQRKSEVISDITNNVAKTSMRSVIHIVELVVSPTHVVMSVKVESVTKTGEVPAHG